MTNWLELEDKDYTITTGDGKVWTPLSFVASWNRDVEYNIAIFNFPDVSGSKVHRGTPQGKRYNVEIIFNGDNNLDTAKAFDKSAANRKPWILSHPFYGNVRVHPIRLKYDNGALNNTVVSGEVMETIGGAVLQPIQTTTDTITAAAIQAGNYFTDTIELIPNLNTSALQQLQSNINAFANIVLARIATVQYDIDDYKKKYAQANAVFNTALYDTLTIISDATDVIQAPADFEDTVKNRLAMLQLQYSQIAAAVTGILALYNAPTFQLKKVHEQNGGVTIAAMCQAAVTNINGDYDYNQDVLDDIAVITNSYNTYIQNLYTLQTLNGAEPDSYIPDPQAVTALQALVFETVQQLYVIAGSAKQQRVYTLPVDDNVLTLAYTLYPTIDADIAATQIINNNNIGEREIFVIKQGREIIYYV